MIKQRWCRKKMEFRHWEVCCNCNDSVSFCLRIILDGEKKPRFYCPDCLAWLLSKEVGYKGGVRK